MLTNNIFRPSQVHILCYVTTVLVILPGTLPLRLALLPVTLWLTFRAFTTIDVVGSNPSYGFLGYGFGVSIVYKESFEHV